MHRQRWCIIHRIAHEIVEGRIPDISTTSNEHQRTAVNLVERLDDSRIIRPIGQPDKIYRSQVGQRDAGDNYKRSSYPSSAGKRQRAEGRKDQSCRRDHAQVSKRSAEQPRWDDKVKEQKATREPYPGGFELQYIALST